MKVVDIQSRDKLAEGRTTQMGFAFCKKLDNETVETVQPISPCKDYLNDVVWAEHIKKPVKVYGLDYSPVNIVDSFWYLAIKICKTRGGSEYPRFKEDFKNLKKNYQNILKLLNHVENLLKFEDFSTIHKANDDIFVLKVPAKWCQYTYSISLYSLLVRMGQFYEGENPDEFLENYNNHLDTSLWTPYKKRFKQIIETGFKEQDLNLLTRPHAVHNEGFCTTKLWS